MMQEDWRAIEDSSELHRRETAFDTFDSTTVLWFLFEGRQAIRVIDSSNTG